MGKTEIELEREINRQQKKEYYEKTQEIRATLIASLRGTQLIGIVMLIASIGTLLTPIFVWALSISAILAIWYEYDLEKKIKKKMKEQKEEYERAIKEGIENE